jgi:hypothetical protein
MPVEPPAEYGLLPGRGPPLRRPMPVLAPPNGLLPGRGPDGRCFGPPGAPGAPGFRPSDAGPAGAPDAGSAPAGCAGALNPGSAGAGFVGPGLTPGVGVAAGPGVGAAVAAAAFLAASTTGSPAGAGAGAASVAPTVSAAFWAGFAAPLVAAAFFAAGFLATGGSAANDSFSRRTTGASTVDEADRTNSPRSFSLARTTLLSTPNSLASSYTRTFATALLLGPGVSSSDRLGVVRVHRCMLIERSRTSRRVSFIPGQSPPDRSVDPAVPAPRTSVADLRGRAAPRSVVPA